MHVISIVTGTVDFLHAISCVLIAVILLALLILAPLVLSLARATLRFVNEPKQVGVISLEVWIVVFTGAFILPFASLHRVVGKPNPLVETVHIQLSDEGSIIVMLEQFRD